MGQLGSVSFFVHLVILVFGKMFVSIRNIILAR